MSNSLQSLNDAVIQVSNFLNEEKEKLKKEREEIDKLTQLLKQEQESLKKVDINNFFPLNQTVCR